LRTPLTHIIGYLELLDNQDLGTLNSNQKSGIKTMVRSSSQLERLINDLIMYTTIENKNIKLNFQSVDLANLFEYIAGKSIPFTQENQITLSINIEDEAKTVYADRDKLQWVLLQLVENAGKFSPHGGIINLSAHSENQSVRIIVSDEGIGFPPDQYERIFDAFYQIDGSSTRKFGGTGMGLSLVKRLLNLHNTTIQVISKENQGSAFSFLIQKPL
jgi:hypothetical protein